MSFRWAVTSAGKIAADFANAVRQLPGHEVVAVAARSEASAAAFSAAHCGGAAKAYGGKSRARTKEDHCRNHRITHTQPLRTPRRASRRDVSHDVHTIAGYEAMFSDRAAHGADACYVATQPDTHARCVEALLKTKTPTLCEKPLAVGVESVEDL